MSLLVICATLACTLPASQPSPPAHDLAHAVAPAASAASAAPPSPARWEYTTTGTPPRAPEAVSSSPVGHFLARSPDTTLIATPVAGGVGIFDGKTLELRNTIPSDDHVWWIAIGAKNEVLVGGKNSLTAFRADGTEIYRHEVAQTPRLWSSPDGLLATKTIDKTCEILDTATGEVVSTITTSDRIRDAIFLGNQYLLVRCYRPEGPPSAVIPGWRVYDARKGTEWEEASRITVERGRFDPIPCPDGGCYWVDRELRVSYCRSGDDRGRGIAKLGERPFKQWQDYFATPTGFLWVGVDDQGPYVKRYDHDNEEQPFERFELTDAMPLHSGNQARAMHVTFDGRSMITLTRARGVEREFRLARFDLSRAGEHHGESFKGSPAFARKGYVEFDLRSFSLKSKRFSSAPRDVTPMSRPRAYSRTHALLSDGVLDRKKRKFRKSKSVSFNPVARISDGGKHVSLTQRVVSRTTEVFSTHPRNRRGTFESSHLLCIGPKGNTYAIDRQHRSGHAETLIARKRNGDELWRVTELEVRPTDVSPDGKHLCVESGILDTETGEWIHRWESKELAANPRFNADGKYAVFVVKRSATEWVWEFYDPKKKEVAAVAAFPVGAEPAAISDDGRWIVARFGTLGAQRLYERK